MNRRFYPNYPRDQSFVLASLIGLHLLVFWLVQRTKYHYPVPSRARPDFRIVCGVAIRIISTDYCDFPCKYINYVITHARCGSKWAKFWRRVATNRNVGQIPYIHTPIHVYIEGIRSRHCSLFFIYLFVFFSLQICFLDVNVVRSWWAIRRLKNENVRRQTFKNSQSTIQYRSSSSNSKNMLFSPIFITTLSIPRK